MSAPSAVTRLRRGVRRLTGSQMAGAVALTIVSLTILIAVAGPLAAPFSPTEIVGVPFSSRSGEHWLGTDALGRDVLSRVLHGGRSSVVVAAVSTIGAYLLGGTIGMIAGFRGGRADAVLMRSVDVLLAFPPILFLLVIAAGLGPSAWTLVLAVIVIFAPSIARVVRAATQATSRAGFVEAAVARGESTGYVLAREILPNLRSTIVADAGPRLTYAILLVAAVNYLGLGLRPPGADWALMISENRAGLDLQIWSVAAPAALIALLTVGVNLLADRLGTAAVDQADDLPGAEPERPVTPMGTVTS